MSLRTEDERFVGAAAMVKRSRGAGRTPRDADDIRDQEVARANRELAAYFKGRRTEREARAALKIVKAYIRDRERVAASSRRPLPGLRATEAAPAKVRKPKKKARKTVSPQAPLEVLEPMPE
jgi:hypothetical protein